MPPVRPRVTPVGKSPLFLRVLYYARKAAACAVLVLLLGETGSGKEDVARFIHQESCVQGEFLAVNCGAFQDTNLEVELFGSEKGAFTSAESKAGLVEAAADGTLFLDEVGEMSPAMQVKLLRLLQSQEYRRVGGLHNRKARCRIIAATHRDLCEMVNLGTFREDLFYRLCIMPIVIPPLRERPEDIVVLAVALLERARGSKGQPRLVLEPAVLDWMALQPWPGNVRQLGSFIELAAVLSDSGRITMGVVEEAHTLRSRVGTPGGTRAPAATTTAPLVLTPEVIPVRDQILAALAKAEALREIDIARACGVARPAIRRPLDGLVSEGLVEKLPGRRGYRRRG
ncbi:MAG: sigma 54-interacting transcriptional regulator [Pseudomonadota bacterium]